MNGSDVTDAAQLAQLVGKEFPASAWVTVDQGRIDRFAEISGDHQWIHTDAERAKRESPYGQTIAHGNLLLILAAELSRSMLTFSYATRMVNYGFDKVRFLTPVPSGGRVRVRHILTEAELRNDGATRVVSSLTLDLEGADRPALIASAIKLIYS